MSLSKSILTVVSRKLTWVSLMSEVNLILGCMLFRYIMNFSNSSRPCVQIMKMSSINLSHSNGLLGQLLSAFVSTNPCC